MKILVILMLFLSACISSAKRDPIQVDNFPKEVVDSCIKVCKGHMSLIKRNKFSYFCTCRSNKKTCIIGSLGTVYK